MNINKIFNRVAQWNSLRYPRIYNRNLTIDLLREEHQELLDASEPVDKLDALCDIIYVACGALWKLKQGELYLSSLSEPETWIEALVFESDILLLKGTITSAMGRMSDMGLSGEQCIKALEIVCDSNDSKSFKMTAPGIKANDGDKGENFIAPEPRLLTLLGEL